MKHRSITFTPRSHQTQRRVEQEAGFTPRVFVGQRPTVGTRPANGAPHASQVNVSVGDGSQVHSMRAPIDTVVRIWPVPWGGRFQPLFKGTQQRSVIGQREQFVAAVQNREGGGTDTHTQSVESCNGTRWGRSCKSLYTCKKHWFGCCVVLVWEHATCASVLWTHPSPALQWLCARHLSFSRAESIVSPHAHHT